MQLTQLFAGVLAAASTVTAIDVYIHEGLNCGGNYALCTGLPPDTCCGVVVNRASVAFLGIPTNWHLSLRAHKGGSCSQLSYSRDHRGSTNNCLNQLPGTTVTGGGYSFVNAPKKVRGVENRDTCAAAGGCKRSVTPNMVGFADGPVYDLAGLEKREADEILAIAARGAHSSEVPASFEASKVKV